MDLIVCCTPYQIMTAFNLRLSNVLNQNCDLLIHAYFPHADEIGKRIEQTGIFQSVRVSDTRLQIKHCSQINRKIRGFLWNMLYIIQGGQYTKSVGCDKPYDRIYYSFIDPMVVAMGRYLCRKKADIEFIAFEDGASTYYTSMAGYTQKHLRPLLNIPIAIYHRKKLYMYTPELAENANGKYEIFGIQNTLADNRNRKLINYVLDWTDDAIIREKIIYFDQLPNERMGVSDRFNEEVARLLLKFHGNHCIVKKHPRRMDDLYQRFGISTFPYSSIPFEVCCLNIDCTEKVLITNISTACLMPKLIFGYEPIIIFLYYIEHQRLDPPIHDFLQRFASSYQDRTKLYFPKTMDEFETVLQRVVPE